MTLRSSDRRNRPEPVPTFPQGMPAPGSAGLRMPGHLPGGGAPRMARSTPATVIGAPRSGQPAAQLGAAAAAPLGSGARGLVPAPRQAPARAPLALVGAGVARPSVVGPPAAPTAPIQLDPLRRAADAWLALQVSPVLSTFAFLARGLEQGAPPRGAGCAQHLLGPLLGVVVGPVSGQLPMDATEELFQRAAHSRGVEPGQWTQWRASRSTPQLLEDLTTLLHGGSCAEGPGLLTCTCAVSGLRKHPITRRLRPMPEGLGAIPALTPDPTGQVDPWHEALVEFVRRFRGRGTEPRSRFSSEGGPSVHERRQLHGHLALLANTFAGPRRVDRMGGLAKVAWQPGIRITRAWQLRDRAAGTEQVRDELLERLIDSLKP